MFIYFTPVSGKEAIIIHCNQVINSGYFLITFFRGIYFKEGEEVDMEMSVETAFRKSIETFITWLGNEVNMKKTKVFFRTYAPLHYR